MDNLFRQEVFQEKGRRLEGVISLVQPALIKPLALLFVAIIAVCLLFLSANSYSRTERASGILVPMTLLLFTLFLFRKSTAPSA